MSYPPGGPPPYYGPPQHPQWPYPPPPPHGMSGHLPGPPYPYFVPTMMVPVPLPQDQPQPTYITNYIYHGETSAGPQSANPPPINDQVNVVECSGDFEWVPTTSTLASSLTGRAVVGGHEGWDGSPLWVIRAFYNGDLIPGKLSVRHNSATIAYNGKEVPVQNIEVLCCNPESLRWIPASNGNVPPGAIPGGVTASSEKVYVGRARHQLSLTPGKVQQSLGACYISLAGSEVALTMYDVLCRAS